MSFEINLDLKAAFEQRYASKLSSINALYPESGAAGLEARMATSRKDGYWAYVARKEEPPLEFTYGEWDMMTFTSVIERAIELSGIDDCSQHTFIDLGSGAGRLVLWAAATGGWKAARGVELLPGLHNTACAALDEARASHPSFLNAETDVEFLQGSWDDPLPCLLEANFVFCTTTCLPADENNVLLGMTGILAAQLPRGCIVTTTDFTLGEGFEHLDSVEGYNVGTGG